MVSDPALFSIDSAHQTVSLIKHLSQSRRVKDTSLKKDKCLTTA